MTHHSLRCLRRTALGLCSSALLVALPAAHAGKALHLESHLWGGVAHPRIEWRNADGERAHWQTNGITVGTGVALSYRFTPRLTGTGRVDGWLSSARTAQDEIGYRLEGGMPFGGEALAALRLAVTDTAHVEIGAGVAAVQLRIETRHPDGTVEEHFTAAQGVTYGVGLHHRAGGAWSGQLDLRLLRLQRYRWNDGQRLQVEQWSARYSVVYRWF